MHPDIAQFLSRCSRTPSGLVPVKSLWRSFNDSLPAGRRGAWSRDRFLGAMIQGGFAVGQLEGRACVCGLSLPGVSWTVNDGQVALSESAA
jgi:hypothetical protein